MELLLRTDSGLQISERLRRAPEILHAPHLIDIEVAQALRGLLARRELTQRRSEEALEDLYAMPIMRYPHLPLLPRVWELRATVTAYDATYLALAETLGAPLWTRDGRLARAPGHDAQVELV